MKSRILLLVALAILPLGWLASRHSPQPDPPAATPVIAASAPTVPTSTPALAANASTPISENQPATNFLARLVKGEPLPVTLEQLAPYLATNHRNADSLLAAYQATHERALLDEAMAKYPTDPRVAYAAWFRSQPDANDPDALKARRKALDVLKQAAPDNALANYLSAGNYFKSSQPEQAIQELLAGAAKPNFNDYTQDAIQSMTEAYMSAGYSEAESKLAALSGALLPHLAELKQDGLRLVELAKSYQQAGDPVSAQSMLQMCQDLGTRLDDPNSMTLIQPLVGIAIQRIGLEAAVAMASDPASGQASQDQINALLQRRNDVQALVKSLHMEDWFQTASPEDIAAYCDRERIFGEQKTLQWLANRNSNP
jgi:hypothetical protein